MKTENVRGRSGMDGKLDELVKDFSLDAAVVWLRNKFPSFETRGEKRLDIAFDKNSEEYFASARLLGYVANMPESKAANAVNRPVVVVAVKMKRELTDRTSRNVQFNFSRNILKAEVNSPREGLNGLPSQGLFFFYDESGNFRLSLVTGDVEGRRFKFSEAKRQSFYVRSTAANNILRRRFADDIRTFADIKEVFSVEQLTKEFYRKLFDWYEWAKRENITFPNVIDDSTDDKKYNHEALIRLITRLMFTWFIRQKDLVPDSLFVVDKIKGVLINFEPDSMDADNYYRAILQNLFFATFNCQPDKRKFVRTYQGKCSQRYVKTFYRYQNEFRDAQTFLKTMNGIPFLNCALFDCLDKASDEKHGGKEVCFDGFSNRPKCQAHIPNALFFGNGDEGRLGLITLLDSYEFTIDENEVNDGDIALDPELLGKVFENLLGAYNPETEETARKSTGSFYTPREIVDYMVEESLKNYLRGKLSLPEDDARLDDLFDRAKAAEMANTGFSKGEERAILEALYSCKIIDPACGSGAFPMGILNCMTRLISRLDNNGLATREFLFRRYELDKAAKDPTETEEDRKERLAELEKRFSEGKLYPDYARKLYLIENCIYGVDIQPIAAQISKLRFFISLLCDQFRTSYDPDGENYGLLSLPNLEAKFVCANTLIALPDAGGYLNLTTGNVGELRDALVLNRHKIFGARSTKTKEKYKERDKEIRRQIREAVVTALSMPDEAIIAKAEAQIAKYVEERKPFEEKKIIRVKKAAQSVFSFVDTVKQDMLDFVEVDENKERRDHYDKLIDECKETISNENKKASSANVGVAQEYAKLVAGWDPFDQNASSPFFDPDWMFNIKDGFDVVIGNPPYGADLGKEGKSYFIRTYLSAKTIAGKQKGSCDSYSLFVERAYRLTKLGGSTIFILPMAIISSASMVALHNILYENCAEIKCSSYAVRPQPIFENAFVNTTIFQFKRTASCLRRVLTTKMYRKGRSFDLGNLVRNLEFVDATRFLLLGRVPKIGTSVEVSILGKMFQHKCVNDYVDANGAPVYYRAAGGRYFKIVTNYTTHSSAEKTLKVNAKYRNAICCILSSSLAFWFYQIFSDNLNWKMYEILNMRVPVMDEVLPELESIYSKYLIDVENHANTRSSSHESTYHVEEFKEYKIGYSKLIIDEIDGLIGPLYGLTQDEISFIQNYEIEFRMGDYILDGGISVQASSESKPKTKGDSVAQPKRRVRSGGDDDYLE